MGSEMCIRDRWGRLLPMDDRKCSGTRSEGHPPLLWISAFNGFHGFRELFVADEKLQGALLVGLGQGVFIQIKGTCFSKRSSWALFINAA